MNATNPILGDLHEHEVEAGVNEEGEPFLAIRATGRSTAGANVLLTGQLEPDEARGMAMALLMGAASAEMDASTVSAVKKLGMPLELAGAILEHARRGREEG